jgi:hypothetical protein
LRKVQAAHGTKQYVFFNEEGAGIDPTDDTGQPSKYPAPGLPWWPVNVTLAFVNEPTLQNTVNVSTTKGLDRREVVFVALRDIKQDEELLIDYGPFYDRSSYVQENRK